MISIMTGKGALCRTLLGTHCVDRDRTARKEKDPLSWDRNIHGIVQKHCLKCHSTSDPQGMWT